MPSAIPYDPSLALGNLVSRAKLDVLEKIALAQAPADAAEDHLNDLLSLRRSLDMTMSELLDMDIDITDLQKQRDAVNTDLTKAAVDYAKAKIQSEKDIFPLKATLKAVDDSPESPIDYMRSQIKSMPLSADSMKMNVQYFAVDENDEDGSAHTASVTAFVSDETEWMGNAFSGQASGATNSAMASNHSRHSIAGTLVVSVSCTHKMAAVFAPYVLDVDKAIRVWNQIGNAPTINNASQSEIAKLATQLPKPGAPCLTLISGATYGSCFIGMVHVLNVTETTSSDRMQAVAAKVQAQIKLKMMVANETAGGGFSMSDSDDIKSLLSTQNISSHATVVAIGSIPSIVSTSVNLAVQGFQNNDPASNMAQLSTMQNATASASDSLDASAQAARTSNTLVMMKNAQVTATLSALKVNDDGSNKMIDVNSMMTALDDYIQKALAGSIGVPITYYLKTITAQDLAQSWIAKYFPGQFLAPTGDDTAPAPAPAPAQ